MTITVEGDLAKSGRVSLGELARIAGGLQAQLERVALVLAGSEQVRAGRRPSTVVEATRLDLVELRAGSAVLVVEPHDPQAGLFPSVLDDALDAFLDGVDAFRVDPRRLPRGYDRVVVSGLEDLTGGLGQGVTSILVERPSGGTVAIDHGLKQAVRAFRQRDTSEHVTVSGRLHMGDFAPSALRCRIDTPQGPVPCDFDVELRNEVLASMDRLVTARGTAERWQDSEALRVLHLEDVTRFEEAQAISVEQLAQQQGVRPIHGPEELSGSQIDGFDEYLEAIRSLRSA